MAQVPTTMRAWTYNKKGLPRDVLTLTPKLPAPSKPKENEVTVKILYAALNPSGYTLMGMLPWIFSSKPDIPENDFAGVVVAVGRSVSAEFEVGKPVLGFVRVGLYLKGVGSMAEYVTIPTTMITPKPDEMTWQEAAGLSTTGQTALQMMEHANVKAGHRVLLNGASTGVGLFALQIAKAKGLKVTATCSGRNIDLIRSLGADEVIDYTKHKSLPGYLTDTFATAPFDALLDCLGSQDLFDKSPAYLKPSGILVNIGAYVDRRKTQMLLKLFQNKILPTWLGGVPRRYIFFSAKPSGAGSAQIVKLMREGSVRCVIDSEYTMDNALEAYDYLMTTRAKGKVIIKIQDP